MGEASSLLDDICGAEGRDQPSSALLLLLLHDCHFASLGVLLSRGRLLLLLGASSNLRLRLERALAFEAHAQRPLALRVRWLVRLLLLLALEQLV